MIKSFGNALAQDLYDDKQSKHTRQFPDDLQRGARRKLLYLHDAGDFADLRVPPGNRLEALKGKLKGFHSSRINQQWRLVFRWERGDAYDVQVIDYHRG